jgi:CheY-like chemotaxis protein
MNPPLRILCIDDFTSQLNTLKSTLEDRGYEVWTAKNMADGQRIAECLDFEAMVVAQRLANLNPDLARGLAARPSLFLTYPGNSSPSVNRSLTPNLPLSSESVESILAFLPMLRRRTG